MNYIIILLITNFLIFKKKQVNFCGLDVFFCVRLIFKWFCVVYEPYVIGFNFYHDKD